jgi:hypothetical protein
MRLAIVGTILALAVTAASAQGTAPQIMGDKAFCLKGSGKIDCSFDTMAACEKGAKDKSPAGAGGPSCVSRSEAR